MCMPRLETPSLCECRGKAPGPRRPRDRLVSVKKPSFAIRRSRLARESDPGGAHEWQRRLARDVFDGIRNCLKFMNWPNRSASQWSELGLRRLVMPQTSQL